MAYFHAQLDLVKAEKQQRRPMSQVLESDEI